MVVVVIAVILVKVVAPLELMCLIEAALVLAVLITDVEKWYL